MYPLGDNQWIRKRKRVKDKGCAQAIESVVWKGYPPTCLAEPMAMTMTV